MHGGDPLNPPDETVDFWDQAPCLAVANMKKR